MADYDALRQHVEKDGSDFTAWSKLLACVEEQAATQPERVNATFEAFLAKFPLCFGYWCKYADLQRRLGEATKAGADEAQETDEAESRTAGTRSRGYDDADARSASTRKNRRRS